MSTFRLLNPKEASAGATVCTLSDAFTIVNEMVGKSAELFGGYRSLARQALKDVIEAEMAKMVDVYIDTISEDDDVEDRRNGYYRRHLLTALGDIELKVPRTRLYCPTEVLRAYARREAEIDRCIACGFVLGLSTRKIGEALLPLLGRPISASTVSRVAKTLDEAVMSYHARPLLARYRALILDGVVLSRKTGAGALRRPVLVALGLRHDGKKDVLDFQLAGSESERNWERFLHGLYMRGLTEDSFEILCVDGGKGLLAAVDTVYSGKPIQRCWAHKIRNVLDKVKKADRESVHKDLTNIMNANNAHQARSQARRFADRWKTIYPKAVICLRDDLDQMLACFRYQTLKERKQVRTTNAIERRFREVRRRTRPMGAFQDTTSMDRILYAIFVHENKSQGIPVLTPVTHK